MAPLSTALFYIGILAFTWSSCSAESTLEEELQQLKESYVNLKQIVDVQNIQLKEKIVQLETKGAQLEELLRLKDQEHIASLRQGIRNATSINSQSISSNATMRQGLATKMPTSCLDLKSLGHQFNGVYSVIGAKFVETVYCDFSKLTFDPSFETRIGFADIKSKSTYFFVRRNKRDTFGLANTTIIFDEELVNVGGAMDVSTGIFTAKTTGTYFFNLDGLAWFPESSYRVVLYIVLKLNGNQFAFTHANSFALRGTWKRYSLPSTLRLKKGDQIWFEINQLSPGIYLNGYGHTQFTGGLLEEEIFALI